MSLSALFSLITAALITLLPVLLLMGRRRMRRRDRRAIVREGDQPAPPGGSDRDLAVPARAGAASAEQAGSGVEPAGERGILDRLTVRERSGGRRPQEAADRRAAFQANAAGGGAQRNAGPGHSSPGSAPGAGPAREDSRAAGAGAERLEQRLAHLSPLQRAIVYGEVLGKPVALRNPGSAYASE